MATNNNDNNERNDSWKDYYVGELRGTGDLGEIGKAPLSFFDGVADSYFEDEEGPHSQLGDNPENFVLLPGPMRTVRMMHHVFALNSGRSGTIAIGILGTRKSSPFKEIGKAATAPLRVPMSRRSIAEKKIPSMGEFADSATGIEFQRLEGEEGTRLVSDLNMKTNSFWIHPTTFVAFGGPKTFRASSLAQLVIASLRNEDGESSEPSEEASSELYSLLVFLWAVERGYSTSVGVVDPPDTDEFDAISGRIVGRLSSQENFQAPSQDRSAGPSILEHGGEGDVPESPSKSRSRSRSPTRSRSKSSSRDRDSRKSSSRSRSSRRRSETPRKSSRSRSVSRKEESDSSESRSRRPSTRRGRSMERAPQARAHRHKSSPSSSPDRSSSSESDPKPRRRKKRRRRLRSSRGSSDDSLQAKFMQGVIAMTKYQKKAYERDANKKSMLSRLSKQQAQIFTLISARDWHDYRPRINSSTEGLLEDRDPRRPGT
jgi:hypothetical protein